MSHGAVLARLVGTEKHAAPTAALRRNARICGFCSAAEAHGEKQTGGHARALGGGGGGAPQRGVWRGAARALSAVRVRDARRQGGCTRTSRRRGGSEATSGGNVPGILHPWGHCRKAPPIFAESTGARGGPERPELSPDTLPHAGGALPYQRGPGRRAPSGLGARTAVSSL